MIASKSNMISVWGPGSIAAIAMLVIYFGVLTLLSGWSFSLFQFLEFWPFIVALAVGFGAQVGLYILLRQLTSKHHHAHGLLATSGTTSAAAMLACCTHYLANILPLIGAAGLITLVAQYQIELFWIGLAFNGAGLVYIGYQVYASRRALIGAGAC